MSCQGRRTEDLDIHLFNKPSYTIQSTKSK